MGKLRDYANDYTKRFEELQTLYSDMENRPQHYTEGYINRVKRDIEIAKRNFPEILSMADEEDRQIAQLRKSLIPTQGRNKNVDQKVDKLFPSTPSDAPQPIATKNVVIGSGGNGPDFNKWHSEYNQSIQEQARRDQAARETPVSPLSPPQFQSLVSDATRTPKPVIPGTGPKMFSTTGEKTHDLNDLNATGDPAGFFDDPIQLSKNIGKQFLRGVEDHRINKMWADVSRGQFDQNEAMKIEEEFQQRALSDPIDADNWLSGILHSTARMAGHMGATMLRSTGKAAGVGLGAGGIAAATGVGSVAAPAIGLAAAGMAAPLMNYLDWHDQAAGMMYRAMVTNKETPIDPKIAAVVANIVAIPYAAVEMSQINRIAPGATRLGAKTVQNIAGYSIMDNLAKAAAKQTIPSIIGKNFKEYAATWGKEMGEELVQGQIELVSNEFAKHFNNMVRGTEYELNIDDVSKISKEMAKNLWMTAKESAGPLALMTGPRFAIQTKSELNKNKMVDRSYQKEAIERMRPIPLNLSPEKLDIIEKGIQNNEDPIQTAKKAKVSLKAVENVKKTLSEAQGETIVPDDQLPTSNILVQPEKADQTIPGIVDNGQNIPIGKEGERAKSPPNSQFIKDNFDKLSDENNEIEGPLYHGAMTLIDKFDTDKNWGNNTGNIFGGSGKGAYLTSNPNVAENYADGGKIRPNKNVNGITTDYKYRRTKDPDLKKRVKTGMVSIENQFGDIGVIDANKLFPRSTPRVREILSAIDQAESKNQNVHTGTPLDRYTKLLLPTANYENDNLFELFWRDYDKENYVGNGFYQFSLTEDDKATLTMGSELKIDRLYSKEYFDDLKSRAGEIVDKINNSPSYKFGDIRTNKEEVLTSIDIAERDMKELQEELLRTKRLLTGNIPHAVYEVKINNPESKKFIETNKKYNMTAIINKLPNYITNDLPFDKSDMSLDELLRHCGNKYQNKNNLSEKEKLEALKISDLIRNSFLEEGILGAYIKGEEIAVFDDSAIELIAEDDETIPKSNQPVETTTPMAEPQQQPPPPIAKPVPINTGISENQNTYSSAIKNSIVGATINHGKIKWSDVKSLLGKNVAENIVNPKKFVLEITSPNGVSLDEIADDLINMGELHINPNKQNDEHYLETLIDRWNRIQNGDYFNENSQNPTEVDYNAELEHAYGADVHEKIKNAKIIVYGTNDIRTYKTKLEYDRAGESPQLWKSAKKEKGKYIIIDEDLGLTPERNTRQPGMFGQEESSEELPFLVKQTQQKSGKSEFVKSGGPVASVQTEKAPAGSKHWVSSELVKGNKIGKVMTVNDMIKGVRKIFPDITFRPRAHKKMGKAAGFYERGTAFVRTRNDKDIQAITHELAHSLHYLKTKYNTWNNNPDFQEELTRLDYIPERENQKLAIVEGFAEFSRRWATGDPELPNLAPKFLDYFENTFLEENDPDGQWQELKQLLTEYREQDTKSYYDAGLVRSETRYERMMKNTNAFVERAKIHPLAKIQMTYARTISKLHDNARAAEVMLKLALGRSYHQLAYKDRFIELWRMTQGRAGESARRILFETFINPTTGEKMGKSLVDVFKTVCKTGKDMLEFEKYLKAKQLDEIYKDKKGDYILPHGQPIEYLRETIARIENDRPDFIGAREEYATFNNNLLKMVKDAGGFSNELYDNLKHHFSAWVPTEHETIESEYPGGTPGKGTSKAYANISQPIHKLKQGSEAPLVPFIDSYAKHVEKMIAFANKVRAVRSLIDIQDISGEMGEEIKKGLSKIVRVTDAPTSVKGVKIEVLVDALKGLGYEVKPGENATGLDELLNLYFSDYIPKNAKFGTVMVFKDGKPVYLELDKELYNLLMASGEGLNYAGTNILMKALTKAGKMVRYGATTAKISFSLYSNLIADTINRMTASDQALSNPFQTLNGILAELVRKNKSSEFFTKLGIPADMAQKYLASGGAFSTQLGADAKALYDMQNQFKAAVTDHDIVFSLEHPFEAMRTVLSFTENANRIADFKEVYNKVLKQTGDKEEAYIRAVRSSQDVTIDFLRHGDWTKFMSVIKAFYNAQSQGLSKTMRNMTELTPTKYGKDDDGRLIVERNRVKGMYFIPKVIAWHFAMNILQRALMPEDKKEEFDGYQGWKKNGFWHFWIKGHHLWVPCKFVQGAIVNGLINLTMSPMKGKRYKEEEAEYLGHVWNESLAGLIPLPNVQQWLSGTNIIGPFSDLAANKDAFGIPIEPVYSRLNEPNRLKIVNDKTYGITTKATEMMHGLSKKATMLTFMGDISPVQLQYFLGKISGGAYWRAGAWVQLIGDLATGKKITLEKAPVTNVLFREDNPLQRRPVRKFYENIKKADADKEYPNREQYKLIQKQINQFERIYKAYKLKQTPKTTADLGRYQRAYKIKIGLDDKDQFRREVLYNIISKGMEKIGDY